MSYLNTPNLVFTGDFIADVSTINNDVRHYDNASFQPYFQETSYPYSTIENGLWNPVGGNVFAFQNCTVQQICFPDGTIQRIAGGTDPVLGQYAGGPAGKAMGKMVDIDPQWQMSSQLWCVSLRIYTAANDLLLSGDMAVSGFRDLQTRQTNGATDNKQPLGGGWTSVLTNVVWGMAAASSPFLSALKKATQNNTLSIQLNMYGFFREPGTGRFARGRIIGTIGPWYASEPLYFAPNRRLYGVMDWGGGNVYLRYSNFLVDEANARLNIDLGNSFPIADSMGTININTPFSVGVLTGTSDFSPPSTGDWSPVYLQSSDVHIIGNINYSGGDTSWLDTTGGIVSMGLNTDQLQLLAGHQLVLVSPSARNPGQYVMVCRESIEGYNIRADNHNERLEAGLTVDINLHAYQWGKPLSNVTLTIAIQPPTQTIFTGQSKGPHMPTANYPYINWPKEGLALPGAVSADAAGKCVLTITGNRIDWPRGYIDGQIYYISYALNEAQADKAAYSADAIYVTLRSYFEVPDQPTWDDISEVLTQFGNLYPVMSKYVVDLGSEAAVLAKKDILIYAFTRDITDPFYMPVTRDLSNAMRQTIVKWLNNPLPGRGTVVKKNIPGEPPAIETAESPILKSEEIKKVEQLTAVKNGSMNFSPQVSNPFEQL